MVKVLVEQGWLEGELVESVVSDKQYYSFKGIPYAEPPIGKLRFKETQPPLPWKGVRKATEHGPKCPQFDIIQSIFIDGDEDCLYLNVYSPNLTPQTLKPVMFFIHGGGLKSGSGDDDMYGPDLLVDKDVVIVTFNYRLDILGFLCLDTVDVPGNAGLKDQVAALKWVQQNITKFGGDPENVTVFGESAGGASTALHVISPMSKGLFKQAICMSGVPFCDWNLPFLPQKRAFVLGRQLGQATEDPEELLEFLQSLPVDKLVNTNPCILGIEKAMYSDNIYKLYHFTPVKEKDFGQNAFLLEDPLTYIKTGNINNVNLMIGHTKDELIFSLELPGPPVMTVFDNFEDMLVPKKILYRCVPSKVIKISNEIKKRYFTNPYVINNPKEFVKCLSDIVLVYDIMKFINILKKYNKNKCYFYKFSSSSERNVYGNLRNHDLKGISHLDDLFYLFQGKQFNLPINKNQPSYKMIQQTCELFTNFAKYGNPTPDLSMGAIWPEHGDNAEYLDVGDNLVPGNDVNADVVDLWDEIYEMAGGSYEDFLVWN